nr:ABC transporter permease [uncultured Desulfobacter sp.]
MEVMQQSRGDGFVQRKIKLRSSAWIGIVICCVFLFISFFGDMIAPFSESDFVSETSFLPPSSTFWFGTDYIGRDIFSRLVIGTRLTIGMAFLATLFASSLGSILGILAAIKGGWVDTVLSRVNDALMSIPGILAGLVAIAALGPSLTILIVITGLVKATSVYRLARALGMDIRVMDYVEVAKARGESYWWILRHEIFPNVAIPLIVDFGIRLSFAIRFIASLSFLGLGVQPPHADWGSMVRENMVGLSGMSMAPIFPALAIAVFTIGLNLIVDDYVARSGQEITRRIT